MRKVNVLLPAGAAWVLATDFVCLAGHRACAAPSLRLAPGTYVGTLEAWYSLRGSQKLPRVVLPDRRAIPLIIHADGMVSADPHWRWGACCLETPHERHATGASPSGATLFCDGDRWPFHGYYAVGQMRLYVIEGAHRPISQVRLDAVPVPSFNPFPIEVLR